MYRPKRTADDFMRRVGEKYPWLHPDYDPDDELWQMRSVKARATLNQMKKGDQQSPSKGE